MPLDGRNSCVTCMSHNCTIRSLARSPNCRFNGLWPCSLETGCPKRCCLRDHSLRSDLSPDLETLQGFSRQAPAKRRQLILRPVSCARYCMSRNSGRLGFSAARLGQMPRWCVLLQKDPFAQCRLDSDLRSPSCSSVHAWSKILHSVSGKPVEVVALSI